jgi:hypothetical protein
VAGMLFLGMVVVGLLCCIVSVIVRPETLYTVWVDCREHCECVP